MRAEGEARLSPLREVMSAVQQDDHAVHGEDADGQQAERTHLWGEERQVSELQANHAHTPTPH